MKQKRSELQLTAVLAVLTVVAGIANIVMIKTHDISNIVTCGFVWVGFAVVTIVLRILRIGDIEWTSVFVCVIVSLIAGYFNFVLAAKAAASV